MRRVVAVIVAAVVGGIGSPLVARSFAAPAGRRVTFTSDWQVPCTECQTPVVSGGVLYTVTGRTDTGTTAFTSTVRTFDVATGAAGWTHPLGKVAESRVDAVDNGLVYLDETLRNGTVEVVALAIADGSVHFRVVPPRSGNGAAQFVRGVEVDATGLYVVNGDGAHHALSRFDASGKPLWTQQQSGNAGGFALAQGQVFLFGSVFVPPGSQRDSLSVFRETNGRRLHKFQYLDAVSEPFVDAQYANGLVYAVQFVGGEGAGLGTVAIDATTGAIAWTGSGKSAIAVSADVLVAASGDYNSSLTSELYGYDPTSGALLWGPKEGSGFDPVIVGGIVYTTNGVPAARNTLQARDLSSGALLGKLNLAKSDPPNGVAVAGAQLLVAGATTIRSLTPQA